MKIAVLSDTHIPTRLGALPGRVYEICAECDLILHAGDMVDISVIHDLQRFASVKAVHGNMDPYELINMYPENLQLELEGYKICMTHGTGSRFRIENRILDRFISEKPDIIIFGHSHIYHNDVKNGVLCLNPGAVCESMKRRSMALLKLENGKEPEVNRISV